MNGYQVMATTNNELLRWKLEMVMAINGVLKIAIKDLHYLAINNL
jgi:hypothetical protein